jgi:hypothetical protein
MVGKKHDITKYYTIILTYIVTAIRAALLWSRSE